MLFHHSKSTYVTLLHPPMLSSGNVKKGLFVILFLCCSHLGFSKQSKTQWVTDTIQVKGNCEMCKKNIEGSLEVKGVREAVWNAKTHQLMVTYSPSKITILEIEQKISKAGYDTEHVKADEKAYQKLHTCCHYER